MWVQPKNTKLKITSHTPPFPPIKGFRTNEPEVHFLFQFQFQFQCDDGNWWVMVSQQQVVCWWTLKQRLQTVKKPQKSSNIGLVTFWVILLFLHKKPFVGAGPGGGQWLETYCLPHPPISILSMLMHRKCSPWLQGNISADMKTFYQVHCGPKGFKHTIIWTLIEEPNHPK